ncbi:hypothetical protein ACHHYP_13974, partial [Achlya hypogyna]
MTLTLLYLAFAATVAVCTYTLTSLANKSVFAGLLIQAFTYNQFDVPVTTLLQSSSVVNSLSAPLTSTQATWSAADLHFKACGVNDASCAAAFLPESNAVWSTVCNTFKSIPDFDQPVFQDPNQTITLQHINNLSGWNKATAQFSIANHATAITCLIRRALITFEAQSPVVDAL